MPNPTIKTLVEFLRLIKKEEPVTYYGISKHRRKAYGMVSRYLRFCLQKGFIKIAGTAKGRGPKPSKFYVISPRGEAVLNLFGDLPDD